jgi:1,5-anhydro-D-fructose reductase (1,5-anhydro-D-mannitol-forming)
MSVLNWVVVGIGDITTKRVIPAILEEPRSVLYGIVTRDPAKASPYGVKCWTNLNEALADSAVDAVYVATPVALHAPQTVAALNASKHVLCEKPMAMNLHEARVMAAAARNAERLLGIAYYRRTYPKVHRAKELMAQGVIGKPVLAEIQSHDWFANEDGTRGWLLDPRLAGGGALYDIGSHRIDILNFFFGKPIRVTGQRSNVVHHHEVEDSATILIEYDNGLRGIVDLRRHSRIPRDGFRVIGTDGEMDLGPLNGPSLVYPGGSETLPTHSNVHYPCIANFVEAVLDGKPLLASGESSLPTDWVTEQVMRLGDPVRYTQPTNVGSPAEETV